MDAEADGQINPTYDASSSMALVPRSAGPRGRARLHPRETNNRTNASHETSLETTQDPDMLAVQLCARVHLT